MLSLLLSLNCGDLCDNIAMSEIFCFTLQLLQDKRGALCHLISCCESSYLHQIAVIIVFIDSHISILYHVPSLPGINMFISSTHFRQNFVSVSRSIGIWKCLLLQRDLGKSPWFSMSSLSSPWSQFWMKSHQWSSTTWNWFVSLILPGKNLSL